MSDTEVKTLLGQLQTLTAKVDHIAELVNRIAYSSDGSPRCAGRGARIDHLERDVELCHARISGVKKWLIGVLVAAAGTLANYAWAIIQSSAKH